MINPKIYDENEECLNCGGKFNTHFNLCVDCKSKDNSGKVISAIQRHKAVEYREGDMNNHHIVLVTVDNSTLSTIKLIVPYNSQIANRVKYYVDNGIRDYLEEGLSQEYLINMADFSKESINGEIYFVLKGLF